VLDEPTAGLDPKQIIETRQLIRELAGTHTIVLSTHILPEVSQTCQRVVIINKGRVVAVDSPENLTSRMEGAATIFVQADGPAGEVQGTLQNVRGVTRVAPAELHGPAASFEVDTEKGVDVRRELAAAIVSSGWGLLELRPLRLSLEDIFLSLITDESAEPADAPVAGTEEVAHA
jgi:ABC-2 type transport system ATP-binding protein